MTNKDARTRIREYIKMLEILKEMGNNIIDDYYDSDSTFTKRINEQIDEIDTMTEHVYIALDILTR